MSKRVIDFVPRPHAQNGTPEKDQPITTRIVLAELYLLLEDYAPVWYKQEHHDRAVKALLQRER